MQPVDEVLDVLGRILLAHQPGYRMLELATIDDHRRRARETIVLSRVIDVEVGMQNPPNVLRRQSEGGELVLEHLLFGDPPLHAEPVHDLRALRPGVDHDRIVAAEDEEAEGGRLHAHPHVSSEHQKARIELDVDEVQELDFERHRLPFP